MLESHNSYHVSKALRLVNLKMGLYSSLCKPAGSFSRKSESVWLSAFGFPFRVLFPVLFDPFGLDIDIFLDEG